MSGVVRFMTELEDAFAYLETPSDKIVFGVENILIPPSLEDYIKNICHKVLDTEDKNLGSDVIGTIWGARVIVDNTIDVNKIYVVDCNKRSVLIEVVK